MAEISIREDADEARVRAFLGREWYALETEPWTSAQCLLAAEQDGAIIGAASGRCMVGVAHLSELMVAAGGRNAGLGARLLMAFEEWAAAQGAHKYTLRARRDGPAQRFYERHGWRVAHILADHYHHHDYVVMDKWPAREEAEEGR